MVTPDQAVIKAIRNCHATENELYEVIEEALEGSTELTRDRVANILSGIQELNKIRVDKAEAYYRNTMATLTLGD